MRDLWRRIPLPLRRGLLTLLVVGLIVYVAGTQWADAVQAAEAAAAVDPWLIALATVIQVLGIASQALLTRSVLPRDARPTVPGILRVELATMALSHTMPGGTAAGSALAYRLLTKAGIGKPEVGFAIAVRGIGSAIVLNVILWLALVVSIPLHGFDPLYTLAAVVGALLFGAAGAAVLLMTRRPGPTTRFIGRWGGRLPLAEEEAVREAGERLADQTRALISDRRVMVRAAAWSAAYWLLSAASLWVFLAAFGYRAQPDELLVAFGLVNVIAVIPITPRGLGVLEAVLIPTLVGFGAGVGQAIRAVLAWRLVSFWLPIPAGGLAYLSLRAAPTATTAEDAGAEERASEVLSDLSEVVEDGAEDLRDWARRWGVGQESDEDDRASRS